MEYPYESGDVLVLGPECFTNGDIICWRGMNYYREADISKMSMMEAAEYGWKKDRIKGTSFCGDLEFHSFHEGTGRICKTCSKPA
jgi:hypothetical protein